MWLVIEEKNNVAVSVRKKIEAEAKMKTLQTWSQEKLFYRLLEIVLAVRIWKCHPHYFIFYRNISSWVYILNWAYSGISCLRLGHNANSKSLESLQNHLLGYQIKSVLKNVNILRF